jgi:hypothetical protein
MTNEEAIQWMRKLVQHDAEGKVLPSEEALRRIESSYPNASDAEIWGLAQMETMIIAATRAGMAEDLARLALKLPKA